MSGGRESKTETAPTEHGRPGCYQSFGCLCRTRPRKSNCICHLRLLQLLWPLRDKQILVTLSVLAWVDSDSLTFRPSSSRPQQQTGQQALILSLSYGTCYAQKCSINAAQYVQGFCNNDFCSSLLYNKDSEFKALLATCSSP